MSTENSNQLNVIHVIVACCWWLGIEKVLDLIYPSHYTSLAMGKLRDLKYESLEHLPYSVNFPELVSSNIHLFTNFKKCMARKRFSPNEETIAAIEEYFAGLL